MSAYASERSRGSLTKSDAWLYLDELTHRTLNDYAIMLATVRRASSRPGDAECSTALAAIARRLEAGVTAFSALRPPQSSPYRNLDEDLEKLCASLSTSRLADRQIALTLSAEPVMLSSHRSWQVSLIIAELITNAAKHAFDQLTCGAIVVDVKADRNVLICMVRDNGCASLNTKPGQGSRIVDALANDLGGSIARNFSSRGATICLRVPLTRNARTVSELIDEWSKGGVLINRRTGAKRQQVNINNDIALANHHLKPLIGNRMLQSLSKGDIQLLRNRIAGGDSSVTRKGRRRGRINVTGGEGTATRTIRLFSSILSYAVDMELIPRNPALGVKLPPGGQRHRYLSADELRRLGEVLEQPVSTTTAGTAAIILRLLILTGARRGEIEGLKWSEVDFNFGMLRKKTSKTGAKVIPLARVAVEILEEQRRWIDRSHLWVFPAHRGEGHFDGLNKEWHRVRKLAGIDDVRIHDLRHTFASVGAGGGVGLPLIGGILGHRQASTTQRYAHLADGPLRTAADLIGSELAAALAGASFR